MTDRPRARSSRRTTALILGALVLVIAAVAALGLLASGAPQNASTTVPLAQSDTTTPDTSSSPLAAPTATATASPIAPTRTPSPVKRTSAPTPQPTKTAKIAEAAPVPIKKELTATVEKMEAVTGEADGPGEIAGPSVRFTIRITNTTGKPFVLGDTVVNAYYGSAATPAVQLRKPGGEDFPASVGDGSSATGVFLFNIPEASRSTVKVTVDTAVQNPVIAFQGSAPR